MHVLVVEDSPSIGEYLKASLAQKFTVSLVTSAELALHRLSTGLEAQVILLDLHLPGMNGLDLISALRSRGVDLPVVVLTGKGSVRSALDALHRGADWFIEKQDFSREELIEILERAVRSREGLRAQRELESLKKRFYGAITHDLRSPVANALMALELIDAQTEDSAAGVRIARASLERAMQLIGKYLEYDKINAGFLDLNLAEGDLADVVQRVVEMFRPRALAGGVRLIAESQSAVIKMDAERITSLLENLVTNALRYTPSGGTVEVVSGKTGSTAWLEVRDTGSGIDPSKLDLIFRPYERIESDRSGTGLGLAIAREIAGAHKGRISVQSELARGSTFRVELPAE